jgi:Cu/Zn superoxide dismutase
MKKLIIAILGLLIASVSAQAEELVIQMHLIDSAGVGKAIGTVKASSSPYGTILTPNLRHKAQGVKSPLDSYFFFC